MTVFISYPWIAFAVGGVFVGLWHRRYARSAAVAGVLWLIYGIYEYLIHIRILCSGECNIRVDLLLIYPLLLALSLVALWNTARLRATPNERPNARK